MSIMSPITIIITTYQRPQLLKRAILSALNQTWKYVQVWVLDDASGDETGRVVEEIAVTDSRVRYECHSPRKGMLQNYQYGLDHVETEYFTFLSDDDFLLPWYCETVMELMETHPEIAFAAASVACISEKNKVISIPLDGWPRKGVYYSEEGVRSMLGKIPIPNTICFRKCFVGAANIDFENQPVWDWDFILQLAGQFPFAISKKVSGFLIAHPNSFTIQTSRKTICLAYLRLVERVKRFNFLSEALRDQVVAYYEREYFGRSLKFLVEERSFREARDHLQVLLRSARGTEYCLFFLLSIWIRIPGVRNWISPLRKFHLAIKSLMQRSINQYLLSWEQ